VVIEVRSWLWRVAPSVSIVPLLPPVESRREVRPAIFRFLNHSCCFLNSPSPPTPVSIPFSSMAALTFTQWIQIAAWTYLTALVLSASSCASPERVSECGVRCSAAVCRLLALVTPTSGARLSGCRRTLTDCPQSCPNKGQVMVPARTDDRTVSHAAETPVTDDAIAR